MGVVLGSLGTIVVAMTSTLLRLTPKFWMIAAGLGAMVVAAVIYRVRALSVMSVPVSPAAKPTAAKARFESKGPTGWSALLPLYARGALIAVALDLIVRGLAPAIRGFDAFASIGAGGVVWVAGAFIPMSIRMLRGLPIGCLRLTFILQAIIAVSAILAIGSLALVFKATHQDTIRLPAYFYIVLGLISLRLPTELRLGAQTAFILSLAPITLLPVTLMIAPHPVMVVAMIATLVGWVWTYWELSRGRYAYRQRPIVAARWRGPMG